ncbi:MAG TPA: ABC-F family ATP-binding cassette domain-containing protein, partial [Phycisphaerales bacterium]|nr:ABC-F family ATP-binding cassette domain-containing protein [Phycisphaerales bacterium]
MSVVAVVNVAHSYGSHPILDGVTLSIAAGEKIGLVGRNGQGKTTLMKMMTGEMKPDSGSVQVQRGVRVGYLSQHVNLNPDETLRGEAEGAFAELHELHRQLEAAHEEMAHVQGDALDKVLKRCADIESRMEAAGGYAIDHKIDAMLHGLGFTDAEFTIPVRGLSGGQKARVGLARLLLEAPDVLLMDEPTNHLDIEGRRWLEEFLAEEYPGAVVIVSHDRWLLDRVVGRIVEVERGKIREYPGNYHAFVEQRALRLLSEERAFEKQQDKIKQEQAFIDRYRAGQRAKQARGREMRLERMKENEGLERPVELEVMKLALPKAERSGDQVIVAEGIRKKLGERVLFNDFSITVMRGQRVGIIGPNGTGKTTLLKCLLGEMEVDAGVARIGSRLKIGYFKQMQDDLDMSLRVWE